MSIVYKLPHGWSMGRCGRARRAQARVIRAALHAPVLIFLTAEGWSLRAGPRARLWLRASTMDAFVERVICKLAAHASAAHYHCLHCTRPIQL